MIEKAYELGALIGKNSKEVSLELSCYLIGIYDYFQEYSKSFDVMLVMAELSDYWVANLLGLGIVRTVYDFQGDYL